MKDLNHRKQFCQEQTCYNSRVNSFLLQLQDSCLLRVYVVSLNLDLLCSVISQSGSAFMCFLPLFSVAFWPL